MKKLSVIVLVLSVLVACRREIPNEFENKKGNEPDLTKNVSNIDEMIVPAAFNYETNKTVEVNISVSQDNPGNLYSSVYIYNADPDNGGAQMISGSVRKGEPYQSRVTIPSSLNDVYVVVSDYQGVATKQVVPVTGNQIVLNFFRGKTSTGKGTTPSPTCSSGCTSTINNNTTQNTLSYSSGTRCITGNVDVTLNLSGTAVVRVCANGTLRGVTLGGSAQLIVTSSSSSLDIYNLNWNSSTAIFQNWGSGTDIIGSISPAGTGSNDGTMTVSGDLNVSSPVSSGCAFTNNSSLTVGGNNTVNSGASFVNAGSLLITGNHITNSGGLTTNSCYMRAGGNVTVSGPNVSTVAFANTGYVRCLGNTEINSNAYVTMTTGSMWQTVNMVLNGKYNGITSTTNANCLIKTTSSTTINSGGLVNGKIMYCDANGIETNNGTIGSGASTGCTLTISTSSCNPDGNVAAADTDSDGVTDVNDAYPSDATRAYNNYYPSSTGYATVAFEDLWPYKGDYDVNDIVIDLRHNIVTNAAGKVVDFRATYIYRAHGGNQTCGFAVELPTARTNVNSASLSVSTSPSQNSAVTNQVLVETGTTNACLQLFDNSYNMAYWNTVIGDPRADTITYTIVLPFTTTYTNSTSLSSFNGGTVDEFNPFIWAVRSDRGRTYEIHLPGATPTSQANTSVFGTADDNTNPSSGVYYKSDDNLPFAILTSGRFEYPVELTIRTTTPPPDITQVYLRFAQWSQSGGTLYTDWFSNRASGYRTSSAWIYTY